jgi:tetratricopeptide (TPR) repeat protein
LQLEADLYLAYYHVFHKIGSEKEQINGVINIEKLGKKFSVFDIQARAIKVLQNYYWYDKKNYEAGFDYALKLDRLLKTTNARDFPDLPEYYDIIGNCYYLFRDYKTAIKYFKNTINTSETSFNWKPRWAAANTLGLCYMKLNKIDSSDYYFKKATQSKFLNKDSIQYSISMGNIANNLYKKGKFEAAEPLFWSDISNALKNKDYGLAAGAMIPLADIFINQGKMEKAWELLQKSENFIRKTGQNERNENLYPVISRWYDKQGMQEKAIRYRDSAIIAVNNNNNTFSTLMVLRVQQKVDRQKLEQTELQLEEANRNRKIKTIAFILFIIVVLAFILLYYRYMKRIYKEKQRANEAELSFSEAQLDNAQQKIDSFLKEIENKNTLISKLQNIDYSATNNMAIEEIKKAAILTDEDWENFRQSFEQIYPGYIERLRTKYSHITPAEIRIVVLSRLNLSHKEIANILGISAQSSRVTWHRLKKKLDINEHISLYDLSMEI